MNKSVLISFCFFLFLIAGTSCNRVLFVVCDDCYSDKPDEAEVKITFTINKENSEVPFTLYKGKFDTGEAIYTDIARTSSYSLSLKMNQYYSVVAEYKSGSKTIRVVNGVKLTTYQDSESCDDPCWVITGDKLNAELKY